MDKEVIIPKPELRTVKMLNPHLKEMKTEPTLCGFNAANSAFIGALLGMVFDMMMLNHHPKFLYDASIENVFRSVIITNKTNSSDSCADDDIERILFLNTMTFILSLQVLAGILLMRGIYKHQKYMLLPWIILKTISISCMTIYFLSLNFKSKYVPIILSLVYCDLTLFTILCLLKLYHRFKMEERLSICVVDLLSIQICSHINVAKKLAMNGLPGVHLNPATDDVKSFKPLAIE